MWLSPWNLRTNQFPYLKNLLRIKGARGIRHFSEDWPGPPGRPMRFCTKEIARSPRQYRELTFNNFRAQKLFPAES